MNPIMWSSSSKTRRRKKNDLTAAEQVVAVAPSLPLHHLAKSKKVLLRGGLITTDNGVYTFLCVVIITIIATAGVVIRSPAAGSSTTKNQPSSFIFSFENLWDNAGLPKITKIEIVDGSDPSFDVDKIYDINGKTLPRIIRGTTDMSTFPPHTKWNDDDGPSSGKGFLYNQFQNDPDFATVVMDGTVYMRGTDAFEGTNPKLTVVSGNEGVEWLFGETLTRDENKGKKSAYMGLKDIRKFPEILKDLEGLPKFMVKDDSHAIPFENHYQSMALWAGTGGNVNSGLHYDMNKGGFMYLVKGRKQILMFPQSDYDNLYMRTEKWHHMESSLHIGKILEERRRMNDDDDDDKQRLAFFETQYKKLWDTKPYLAEMEAGDVMYIPHEWFHEIYTQGDSIGISTWVTSAG